MEHVIKKTITSIWANQVARKRRYASYYKKVIRNNPDLHLSRRTKTEKVWLDKWRKYDKRLTPVAYRVFSRYIGDDINIVPMEVCINVIEPVLTPTEFQPFYRDKNSIDKILPKGSTPKTFIRRIRGNYYDTDYHVIKFDDSVINNLPVDKLILKPALEDSGIGIKIFNRGRVGFTDSDNNVLSCSFLDLEYGANFLIQDVVKQSEFTSLFNPSSLNTFRVATYRDTSGRVHVINQVFKIGKKGRYVDNAHSGGLSCGVSHDGELGKYVSNTYGCKQEKFNGIDFKNNTYITPDFEQLKKFAISVSEKIIHHNLVALDIALDSANNPVLIEYNTQGFAGWIFQLSSGSIFGKFTDEVMNYCWKKRAKQKFILRHGYKDFI
jgi:hypothetical protein